MISALLGYLIGHYIRPNLRLRQSLETVKELAQHAAEAWTDGEVLAGASGLIDLIVETDCDLVLNAVVGSAGLGPTVAARTSSHLARSPQ